MGISVQFDNSTGSVNGSVQAWLLLLIAAAVIGLGFFLGTTIGNKVA